MSVFTRDYDYELPESLIASHPLPERDASRMMVVHRASGQVEHTVFGAFPQFVQPGDLLVLNNTRVIPARVFSDDGKVELLFLNALGQQRWKCLVKPGRRARLGAELSVDENRGIVEEILPEGERIIGFDRAVDFAKVGRLPLPPYLRRAPVAQDETRYQTVYAEATGAIAAPTAGLHFTRELLARLPHVFVTLHVGVGTFRPVQTERLSDHVMHAEDYEVTPAAAAAMNGAARLVAVGTTSVRVLETCCRDDGLIEPRTGATNLFLYPPCEFRAVDALLTNFHLPRSTLLALVCAFGGRELIMEAYREAIAREYRFYSYGDCMLIL